MPLSSQSEIGEIKQLVLKHGRDAFVSSEAISQQWQALNYLGPPDFVLAVKEYEHFVSLLSSFDIQIHFLPRDETTGLDSIYTRDASIVCDKGVILCNMGKPARHHEPEAQKLLFQSLNLPILDAISGEGCVEGGDVVWLDNRTLAVGRSYRTNDEGIRQLRELLGDCLNELIVVPLPHWRGPNDVFHLMSIISPIDHNLALVYSPLMPVPFRETLLKRGIDLIEVPENEFETMGCNVLAVAPRKCVMLTGNPETRHRLEQAGVEVYEFQGQEICHKGCGGPTCLTRPFLRSV